MALRTANNNTRRTIPPRALGSVEKDVADGLVAVAVEGVLLPSRLVTKGSPIGLAIAYATICVIWGSTYLAIKVGLVSFDPLFFAGIRYLLATVIMFPIARWQGVSFSGPLHRWWPAFGVGVLFIGISNGLVFWSETRLDSGFTALLISTSPLWTALLSPLLPGEEPTRVRGWAGVAIGFVGALVLVAPSGGYRVDPVAAAAIELSVVVWVATSLWVRRISKDFHPLALTTAQMAAGAVTLLAGAAVRGEALVGPVVASAVAALLYLAVFGSCVGFGAYFYLLRHWEASRVSTSTYINPVIAVLLGWSILDETVTVQMVAGTAVILAGVALVLSERRRHHTAS
ncbi:MAG: EamA family transporter [Acidobacteriota bacterium]